MNISSSNVDIRTDHFHGASAVRFTVKGYLSHYSCGIAAKAWKDCAAENHQKHLLILDLTKMIAHESSSRKTMVSTIQLTKRKIQTVLKTKKLFIRIISLKPLKNFLLNIYRF